MRRMIIPAIIIGMVIFFTMGLSEQMNAAARSCARSGGTWVAVDTVDWITNPAGACDF